MGIDLYIHVEVKIDNQWHHLTQKMFFCLTTDHNYQLFLKLGWKSKKDQEEKGSGAITTAKGLPNDATIITRLLAVVHDSRSYGHSWLSSTEVAELEDWWDKERQKEGDLIPSLSSQLGWLFNNRYKGFVDPTLRSDYPNELENFRWVFWFC